MSSGNETIPVVADVEKDQQTGQDVAAIDAEADKSSQTGEIPQSESRPYVSSLAPVPTIRALSQARSMT